MKQILFFLFLLSAVMLSLDKNQPQNKTSVDISNEQKRAFAVLQNQCNVCHKTQNPSKIFTIENMNGFVKKINRQVFVWKRMPKGKKNNLTTTEKRLLKTWLENQ